MYVDAQELRRTFSNSNGSNSCTFWVIEQLIYAKKETVSCWSHVRFFHFAGNERWKLGNFLDSFQSCNNQQDESISGWTI